MSSRRSADYLRVAHSHISVYGSHHHFDGCFEIYDSPIKPYQLLLFGHSAGHLKAGHSHASVCEFVIKSVWCKNGAAGRPVEAVFDV
jgi:hypothetical protein